MTQSTASERVSQYMDSRTATDSHVMATGKMSGMNTILCAWESLPGSEVQQGVRFLFSLLFCLLLSLTSLTASVKA